ncbi:hypothetical protein ACWFOS_18860 [Gordonia terrae]
MSEPTELEVRSAIQHTETLELVAQLAADVGRLTDAYFAARNAIMDLDHRLSAVEAGEST